MLRVNVLVSIIDQDYYVLDPLLSTSFHNREKEIGWKLFSQRFPLQSVMAREHATQHKE
jgi:hypothetical protein